MGHKTASVVMSQAFGVAAFSVDTHIHRLMFRWGLSNGKSVKKTEEDAKRLFPKKKLWNKLHIQIILYGRKFSPARGWKIKEDIIMMKVGRKSILKKNDLITNYFIVVPIFVCRGIFQNKNTFFYCQRKLKTYKNHLGLLLQWVELDFLMKTLIQS